MDPERGLSNPAAMVPWQNVSPECCTLAEGWSEEDQDRIINEWSNRFDTSGLSYKELIREPITDPAYGRK